MQKIGRTILRRRREGKTDYKARFGLLKSGKQRLVVRKTNKYIVVQIVISDLANDKIIFSSNSKELLKYGWPKDKEGSLKNRTAAYLAGYLLAKKSKDLEEAILDIGLQRNIKQSRLYSALKGVIDGGLNVPHSEKALPSESMFNMDLLKKVKESIK